MKILLEIGAILLLVASVIALTGYFFPKEVTASWWPEIGNNWAQRKQLTLTNNSGATLNSTAVVAVSIDTKSLVDSGKLRSDCNDLRIVYHNTSSTATELTRHLVYSSGGTCANSTATKVNFILQANITNGSSDTNYYLYYSNPQASTPSSTDNAFDISTSDALLVCPFDGSTTCAAGETPSTSTGALRYSGSKSALSLISTSSSDKDTVGVSSGLSNGSSVTFEGWVKFNTFTHNTAWAQALLFGQTRIDFAGGGSCGVTGVKVNYDGSGVNPKLVASIVANASGSGTDIQDTSVLATGTWYHIAYVFNGSTLKLFKNGVQVAQTNFSGTPQWATYGNASIGVDSCGGGGYADSFIIDEYRVSNVARYTSNFAPPTAPFVRDSNTNVLLHFDENGSDPRNANKAIDDSGNSRHGSISGAKYVGGLTGVDSSTSDTGYYQTQSYAGHNGIFVEEGTTNKITNPSFDHSTYDTNWDAVGANLTVTANTTAPYYKFGSKSAKIVAAGAISGSSNMDTIGIDPDSTSTHTLSAYVYNGTSGAVGGTVDANVAKLVFEGVAQTTTYTDMGGGWWRLTYSAATTDSTNEYGIEVADTKTIYIDGVQLEAKAYATTYTDGTLGTGYAWTGTAHNSTSTRTADNLGYSTTNNLGSNTGTINFWVKPNYDWRTSMSSDTGRIFFSTSNNAGVTVSSIITIKWRDPANGDPNKIWVTVTDSSNGNHSPIQFQPASGTAWKMLTLTYRFNGGDGLDYVKVYDNGSLASSSTSQTIPFTMRSTMGIGVDTSGNYPGDAAISDFRSWDTALDSTQIGDLYRAGLLSHSQGTVLDRFSNNKGEDPVGTWHFDEGYGTTTYDSSVNKNNGTITGATWTTEDQCVAGKCLKFDGTDDYVEVSDNTALRPNNGSWSVAIWAKPIDSNQTSAIISKRQASGDYEQWGLYVCGDTDCGSSGQKLTGFFRESETIERRAMSNTDVTDGSWHHYTMVADSSANKVKLYLDGVELATSLVTDGSWPTVNNTDVVRIGDGNGSLRFNGYIDELKIYPYARSSAQILTDFNSGSSRMGVSADISSPISENLSNGLVGYWKMDESTANTCTGGVNDSCDSSGNSNNGAWNGDATSAAGKFGNGTTFDGTGDYISLSDSSNLSPGTGNFTVSAWVKTTVVNSDQHWIYGDYGSDTDNVVMLSLDATNKFRAIFRDGLNNTTDSTGTTTPSTNTWYHVVAVKDGTTNYLYVNGSREASNTNTSLGTITTSDATAPVIGKYGAGATFYWNGTMDEIRVYQRALSSAEISSLYNFAPGPRVELRMEEGTGTNAYDSSGNSRNGTINGNPLWSNGKYGKGLKLDGTGDNISVGDF